MGSPFHVTLEMLKMILSWVFTGVYDLVLMREKKDFWDELGAIKGLWDDP